MTGLTEYDFMEIDDGCVQEISDMMDLVVNKDVYIDGFNTIAQVFYNHGKTLPKIYSFEDIAWALNLAFIRLAGMYHVGKKYVYLKDRDYGSDSQMGNICKHLSILYGNNVSIVLCRRMFDIKGNHSSKGRDDFALLLDIAEFGSEDSIIVSADKYADREVMLKSISPFDRVEYVCGQQVSCEEIYPSKVELNLWGKRGSD